MGLHCMMTYDHRYTRIMHTYKVEDGIVGTCFVSRARGLREASVGRWEGVMSLEGGLWRPWATLAEYRLLCVWTGMLLRLLVKAVMGKLGTGWEGERRKGRKNQALAQTITIQTFKTLPHLLELLAQLPRRRNGEWWNVEESMKPGKQKANIPHSGERRRCD